MFYFIIICFYILWYLLSRYIGLVFIINLVENYEKPIVKLSFLILIPGFGELMMLLVLFFSIYKLLKKLSKGSK